MIAKVNARIELATNNNYEIRQFDINPVFSDLIGTQTISNSQDIEFIFGLKETRKFRPELQIRIFDEQNNKVFRRKLIIQFLH
jgi:hypothetical protein